jgi:hypothetical protein
MHPALRAAAERRLGLFTTADAVRAGYGASEIRSLCRSGSWLRPRRGVLIEAEAMVAAEAMGRRYDVDCLAVLLSLDRPTALLSHATAARLWDLPTPRTVEPLFRLTDPVQWRRGRDYLMTCAPLLAHERWRTGPLPLTSASRTLIDCAREWPLEDAVVAMDAALLAERTSLDELRRATAAVHHWRGAGRAARATAHADGRAESPLETRGRLRILGSGLPAPELQVEVRGPRGFAARVDAWYEDAAVAVEFDGRVKYDDPYGGRSGAEALWHEKRREDEIRDLGIRVLRVVQDDLGASWNVKADRLRALLALRLPGPRRFTTVPTSGRRGRTA